MMDIQREGGFSAGAIYTWFSSKEELLIGLFDQHTEHYDSAFLEKEAESPIARIQKFINIKPGSGLNYSLSQKIIIQA